MAAYLDAFRALVKARGLRVHAAQEQVATAMDGFISDSLRGPRSWFHSPKLGVYLHGGVGSGKTMLMDLVGTVVSDRAVQRAHFLQFMQTIRAGLGGPNNRDAVTGCPQHSVLLLDEFQVNDIADAMVLRRVLRELDQKQVTMVCTSNRHPDDLYLGGLQRASFVPCIEYIKSRMHILALFTEDHRAPLATGPGSGHFHCPINKDTEEKVLDLFSHQPGPESAVAFTVMGRQVAVARARGRSALLDVSWLEAAGPPDYLALCSTFTRLYVLGVRRVEEPSQARRLIDFVDCAYERRVLLVLQMDCPPDSLFHCAPAWQEEAFACHRTVSRLREMQYWGGMNE